MRLGDPFDTRSPYARLELARRKRLVIGVCNASMLFTPPLAILVALMLANQFSWQVVLAMGLSLSILPLSLFCRRLAQRSQADMATYILVPSLLTIVAVNAMLLEGFSSILIPGSLLLILVAGMVMGPKQSYIMAAVATILWLVAQLLIDQGIVIPAALPPETLRISVFAVIALSFFFVAMLSQLATSDLRRALDDATYDLVQANRRLEEASALKSQFTARTSHELRTPLSAIIAFTDLALRGTYGAISEKLETSLGHVLNSARRLNAIINDLLDLSKIEAGQLLIVEESFPVGQLVETLESTLGERAREKGLDFEIVLAPEMPRQVIGDETRLAQILINLADNAVKFTEHGKVSVHIELADDSRWCMQVRDTGRGIPEEKFQTIFEAFRQLDSPRDAEFKGSGLGLAITRNLVEIMGGKIELQSEFGQGSTFEVVLPLKVPGTASSLP